MVTVEPAPPALIAPSPIEIATTPVFTVAVIVFSTPWRLKLIVGAASPRPPLQVAHGWHSLHVVEFAVDDEHAIVGSTVRELGLPRDTLIAVIVRDGEALPPRGTTTVETGDALFVLAPRGKAAEIEDVFTRWRQRV